MKNSENSSKGLMKKIFGKIKRAILKNIHIKIISVIIASIIWLFVMNVSDYIITVKIEDVPVEKINGEVLTDLDQIYNVIKGDTVDIVIKGRRTIVSKLRADDFLAVADLSEISITNTVQIKVSAKSPVINNNITINSFDNALVLNLEDKITKQFPVNINTLGSAREGYAVAEKIAQPNIITISGAKSVVNKISEVSVNIDISDKSEGFSEEKDIIIYDAYKEPINTDKLELNIDKTLVKIDIFPVKTIKTNYLLEGELAPGYIIGEITFGPEEILVVGRNNILNTLEEIVIDNVIIEGEDKDLQLTFKAEDYLPEGIKVSGANTEILLNIKIEKVFEKNMVLGKDDIKLVNKKQDYEYEVIIPDEYNIKLKGLEKVVKQLKLEDIKPQINCDDLVLGENYVEITFEVLAADIISEEKIIVKVSKK